MPPHALMYLGKAHALLVPLCFFTDAGLAAPVVAGVEGDLVDGLGGDDSRQAERS